MDTNVIAIPRKMAFRDDLVVLPRREYEHLLASQYKMDDLDDAINAGLQEYKKGKYKGPFTLDTTRTFLKNRVPK